MAAAAALALAAAAALALAAAAAPPAAHAHDAAPASYVLACSTASGDGGRIESIEFTSPDGTYVIGDTIGIRVTTVEAFTNSDSNSHLLAHTRIKLETGSVDRFAEYRGHTLNPGVVDYAYTVQHGDMSGDLDYGSNASLHWTVTHHGYDAFDNPISLIFDYPIIDTHDEAVICTLPAPGETGSLSQSAEVVVDGRGRARSVTSTLPNGTYGIGATIPVQAAFDVDVSVDTDGGTPSIALGTGAPGSRAVYNPAASTARTLAFSYMVEAGDNTADLDYDSTAVISLNGGSITDAAGGAVSLALPEPGTDGSLGHSKDIAIDTAAPTVSSVSSTTPPGTYGIGSHIDVRVTFSEDVVVDDATGGKPSIALDTGAPGRRAEYNASASTARTLAFSYTVAAGDNTADLDYNATAAAILLNNGTTIQDAAGNNASRALPDPAGDGLLGASGTIRLDTTTPTVLSVSSTTPPGTYGIGSHIDVRVTFSETVVVYGAGGSLPHILLDTGETDRRADLAAGSNNSNTLVFLYTAQANDATADLDYRDEDSLRLGAGSAIRDAAGNNARLALPAPGGDGLLGALPIEIDAVAPAVSSVSSPNGTGTYGIGKQIAINVNFTKAVLVDGAPVLAMETGGTDRQAGYAAGNNSETLTFLYAVREGDISADLDYANASALSLNGSTIRDGAGNNANTTLPAPGDDGLLGALPIEVDAVAPAVSSVSSPNSTGTYGIGDRIAISVNFTEAVLVDGAPVLAMETGGTDRQARYAAGNNSETLTFLYAIRAPDNAADLDYNGTDALTLADGSSIRDEAGNNANLTLPPPGGDGLLAGDGRIEVSATDAGVLRVTSGTADGAYMAGEVIDVKVVFTENVTVGGTGTPILALEAGETDGLARYVRDGNSTTLTFLYEVREGDGSGDLDYTNETALSLNGSTIRDEAGNNVPLFLPPPGDPDSLAGSKDIAIDTIKPAVSSVSSPNGTGTYGIGKQIAINVNFTKAVLVDGAPVLAMETGDTDRQARYAAGNNSETLTFLYAVREGDISADLDYANASALSLNGSTIRDNAGNNANTTLPPPGDPGRSLAGSKDIAIDTIKPAVSSVSSPNGTGTYGTGDRIAVAVNFTEAVLVEGAPVLAMETGETDRQAPYVEGNNSETLTFLYAVREGDISEDLDYANASALSLNAAASIKDAAGNNANLTLPEPGNDGLLAGADSRIRIDTAQPARENATVLSAVFTARNTATITYSGSLGMPEGREGARVYENVSIEGGYTISIAPENVTGLGGATHRIAFGGAGVDSSQAGTISLVSELVGTIAAASNGAVLRFAEPTIRVAPGETVRVVEPQEAPAPGAAPQPAVAIELDGFTRTVNATGAGNGTRVAINVTGLAPQPPGAGAPAAANATTAEFPVEPVTMIAVFAEVTFPANATASPVPAGGLIVLYASDDVPPEGDIAAALGIADAVSLRVRQLVEIGDNATHIVFDAPVRILLVGQAGGAGSFYVNSTDGAVVPIDVRCDSDSAEAAAAQLGGAGECWIDLPGGGASGGKVIYTYHLTRFGTAEAADSPPLPAEPARENATVVSAVFTARNTATITYSGSLDRPEGYEGDVYESIAIEGGYTVRIAPENVTGLGSATHRIAFGGAGVDSGQAGTISLASELVGTIAAASNGAVLRFAEPAISVAPGETVRVVEPQEAPAPGAAPQPAVAIERDGFTRTVNATGAGNGTRVAINVTGLAPQPPGAGAPPAAANATTAEFPAEPVRMIAVFAEVTFPPNATASSVPPGGLIVLYASDDVPPDGDIAAALGLADAGSLRVRQVVEIGDKTTHIAFDAPVRILLVGQAGGSGAFYVNSTDGSVVPIGVQCDLDSHDAAAEQLGGAGECWIDPQGTGGKVIYTYHLTRFGTAEAAATPQPPTVDADQPEPASVSVLQRPGGEPLRAPASYAEGQTITIAVDFSAPVTVDTTGGTSRLLLETGSAGAAASYTSGSGTDRLEFAYAVRGGDITGRLSYAGTGALELGGGAIATAGGTAASLALPPPGETGSLSAPGSPAVRIDPIGRPVLDIGILDEDGGGGVAGHVSRAAYMAAAEFNERQGRTDGALLINATAYNAGGTAAAAAAADGSAAATALRTAHAGGSGPSVYVGPSTDRGLHAAMPYAADNGIVLVSAGSTAPSLAVEDDTVFRLSPGGRIDAEALARLARTANAQSMIAVLENATHGPPTAAGTSLGDATPPPQGRFSRAFDAALGFAGVPTLSGTVTLEGAAGGPYAAAAAAEALDSAVRSASPDPSSAAVVYVGSPQGLDALAGASVQYPALASAAWIASGPSANSSLLAGDGPAAAFAAQAGLEAVRWSTPSNDLARAVDSLLSSGADAGARHRAYAAYDAMGVIGAAAALAALADTSGDTPAAATVAELLPGTAAAYDGALGDIALNSAGDLWVPAAYDLWTVGRPGGGAGTEAEWTQDPGALDETRACSIALTRAKIDYGPIDSGQTSRPHLQTIVNTGQLSFSRVDLTATPWHVDSPGNCEPGGTPSLPVGLSEIRTEAGGQFSDLAGRGTTLAQGLEAGSRAPLWYRLSLAGYADLPQAEITQCATYVVRCG